ncbi:MAG: signal peptidase II [Lachnospiraceae bacterium]|jgi:signal peptidase II|nr:signal peptidase II [Lachnospiraceae bacterium]
MDRKKRNSCILYLAGTLVLLGVDQYTKYLAAAYLKGGKSIILIKDVFQLQYLENQGAAFGMLQGKKLWFVAITLFMLAAMLAVYLRAPMGKRYRWMRLDLLLLTAGAVGNLIDRLTLDYVVDFFYFELINFPVFNVADIYVTVGMGILAVLILFYHQEEELEMLWPFRRADKTPPSMGDK